MTIQTTASEITYVANGTQTDFPIPFPFLSNGDIGVHLEYEDGSTVILANGADFSVSDGNAVLVGAPLADTVVRVLRNTEAVQPVDLRANDSFPEETIERALDRLTMLIQELLRADAEDGQVLWSEISGIISSNADLQAALDSKLNTAGGSLTNYTISGFTNYVQANAVCVKAKANEALAIGDVVKVVGWNAGENAVEVVKVNSSSDIAFGVCQSAIANGSLGTVTNTGFIEGFDTSAFPVGTILYPSVSGGFTATKPTSGNYQALAYCLRSNANNGAVFVEATEPLPVDYPSALTIKDENTGDNLSIWKGTQEQYDALPSHSINTIYFIT